MFPYPSLNLYLSLIYINTKSFIKMNKHIVPVLRHIVARFKISSTQAQVSQIIQSQSYSLTTNILKKGGKRRRNAQGCWSLGKIMGERMTVCHSAVCCCLKQTQFPLISWSRKRQKVTRHNYQPPAKHLVKVEKLHFPSVPGQNK